MTYNLQKDFLYIQNNLFATLELIGLDSSMVDSYTLEEIIQQCSVIYGEPHHDIDSPADCDRQASLRRAHMNVRRFWYYYTLLKWKMQNA
jgi:hypothetical protein